MLVIVPGQPGHSADDGASAHKLVPSSNRRTGLSRSKLRTQSSATEVAMTGASRASRDRQL
jgi:hypothetical protein